MIRNVFDKRAKFIEDGLECNHVLCTVLGHGSHGLDIAAVDFAPQFPSFVIHFLSVSEETRNSLEAIVEHQKIPFRFGACIYVMNIWQWLKFVKSEPRLQKLPIEPFPIMGDDTIRFLEDVGYPLAELKVVIHILGPSREVPSVDAVNRFFLP